VITRSRYLRLFAAFLLGTGMISLGRAQSTAPAPAADAYAQQAVHTGAWEFGPFFQGGFGVADRSDYSFTGAGVRGGKILTHPWGPGLIRGRFEYGVEIMPFWQAHTPAPHYETVHYIFKGIPQTAQVLVGGGTFTGASVTPIILRWDLMPRRKIAPWIQGGGGLIWTNHKFPPTFLVGEGPPGGTSVFNFTPQFGVGFHYFVKPKQSISFAANAVHISSASLGDTNPGVNASVQLQIGYTWWK
jgi:lipid A 3-O-deacylase